MVKITHECPLPYLDYGKEKWNDYEYCLVHLLEEHPKYLAFMKQSVNQGRYVILDCSTFELGASFDPKRYAYWINELKPSIYIVPDALEDTVKTIQQFRDWEEIFGRDISIPKMGVVQGKTYEELANCYKFMEANANKIAISFDYSYYTTIGLGHNKEAKWAHGRPKFIRELLHDNIWNRKIPHHLLGCGQAIEFANYTNHWTEYNIETLDTSNPVQQGLLGHEYKEYGLRSKDRTKVADTFTHIYNKQYIDIVDKNVQIFKNICLCGDIHYLRNKYLQDKNILL